MEKMKSIPIFFGHKVILSGEHSNPMLHAAVLKLHTFGEFGFNRLSLLALSIETTEHAGITDFSPQI